MSQNAETEDVLNSTFSEPVQIPSQLTTVYGCTFMGGVTFVQPPRERPSKTLRAAKLALLAGLSLALTSCGGSQGSGTTPPPPQSNYPTPGTYTGQIIGPDGYWRQADIDLKANGDCFLKIAGTGAVQGSLKGSYLDLWTVQSYVYTTRHSMFLQGKIDVKGGGSE